jgi:hypothetical protein
MTETEMKNEITALRALLARVATETNIREINGQRTTTAKPISIKLYDEITSAVWGDGGCPRRIAS